jgi:hypothetical protein
VDRFIVGTGRCGSTLLSRMIGENREVASIFEFFNGLDPGRRFQREPVSGATYRELITHNHPFVRLVLERGYAIPEITYPFERPGARHRREQGTPWILGAMLPALAEDPDALYDEVCAFLDSQPPRAPAQHAAALFDWLTKHTGRSVWVERSGASIDYLGELATQFPDARFLHIHRAGEEAALSMREHHSFRFAIMATYRLPPGTGRSAEELERASGSEDQITQLLESRPPVEYFGRWWTEQVIRGFRGLAQLDRDQYRELRFEDLLARPVETLREVAEFLDLPAPSGTWREAAAALVRGVPSARSALLAPEERERLEIACRPGNRLLGRA